MPPLWGRSFLTDAHAMARPPKKTLDFFMHDANARSDRKIRGLRRRHGNDGYTAYFVLLEMLCQEDGMRLGIQDPLDVETAIEETGARDEAHLYSIIQTCADIRLFDKQLWESERIVFSHGLYQRYKSRLEERAADARRKQRKREEQSLQMRIEEIQNQNSDTDPKPDPDPDPDPKHPALSVSYPTGKPRNERGDARQFSTATDRFEAWIAGELPLCKTGRGPNDWDEPSVQIILSWLKGCFGPDKTRSDAIAYISKRNHPDRDEYPTLLARLEEGFAAKEKQAKAVEPIVAPAPADPPPDAAWFEAMKQKALGVA